MQSLSKLIHKTINESETKNEGDHIFIPFGCESAYSDANINFDMMDNMIQYWNDFARNHSTNTEMIYSTPNRFVNIFKANRAPGKFE